MEKNNNYNKLVFCYDGVEDIVGELEFKYLFTLI